MTILVVLLTTAILYGEAVRLPFYADDLQQIPWVKATPTLAYWYRLGPYEDYRPVRFMLLRALYLLTGNLHPALLHTLNLFGHVICALFVGALAMQWKAVDPRLSGPLTAAFFVFFPFATNAVLWVSAISYPLTAALGLAALLVYQRARACAIPWQHGIALLFTLLAGLVYEGGIVAGAAIVWAELTLHRRSFSRWAPAHLAASLLPLTAILHFSTAVPTRFLEGLHPHYNLVALLQALAYPVAPLATRIAHIAPGSAVVWMTVLGVTVVTALMLWHRRGERGRWFLFTLGWVAIWLVMPLTTQPFNWFRDPTRSFYPASAGIALLWGLTVAGLTWPRQTRWRRGLQLALSLVILLPPLTFVRGVVQIHRVTGDLLWKAVEVAESTPGALIVNLPGRVTPKARTYPLMHEGIIPIPPPTNGEMFIATHTGAAPQVTGRAFGAIITPGLPYFLELADPALSAEDLRAASIVKIVAYHPTTMTLVTAGRIETSASPGKPLAAFGETVALRTATCHRSGPQQISVELTWEALKAIEGQPTIFTHWLDATGALNAQADGAALRGLYAPADWQPDEVIHDIRVIEGASAPEGVVGVGIWSPRQNARWPAHDAAGRRLPDDTYRIACTMRGTVP
ncbi:MAG: hypothetical protein ACP5HM_15100 [Anaerolineae bacterium]